MNTRKESLKTLTARYEVERAKLLGKEGDLDQLWRVVVAADKLADRITGRTN